MKQKKIILRSLRESFSVIRKNKRIVLSLLILQLILFSLMFFVNIKYQSKMLESTQAIIEYMEKQKFDQASLGLSLLQQKSVLGDDPLLISRNFSAIAYNLKFLIFYTLIIFILLNGFIWFLTCNLINKNFKSLKIREELNDINGLAATSINIGMTYYKIKQYQTALKYLEKGLTYAKIAGNRNWQLNAYGNFVDVYDALKDYKKMDLVILKIFF